MPFVTAALGQHAAHLHDVLQSVGHEDLGRLTVPACPARLLVVAFEALGQVEVSDEAHVRLVDTHAEGDGGDHDDPVAPEEVRLPFPAGLRVESGMVAERVYPVALQPLGGSVNALATQAVDDAGLTAVIRLVEVEELGLGLVLLDHPVADVGPVEAGDEAPSSIQVQLVGYLATGGSIGSGCQRQPHHSWVALSQQPELYVLWPEVVAPLRHAVSLVDGEEVE